MNQPELAGQSESAYTSRPPSYLARAVILTLVLVPLGLILTASKLIGTINILYGTPVISEIPSGLRALMEILAGVAAFLGIFMPIAALAKALQVNRRFVAGDRSGAEAASRRAAYYSRQSIFFVIVMIIIMLTDIFRYVTA